MIKLIIMMKRKPGISHETFADYWLNKHGQLVVKHADTLKIRRYIQSHTIAPKGGQELRQESDGETWDGITEVWLDGLGVLAESHESPEIRKVQAMLLEDEANFVDLSKLRTLITEEHELIYSNTDHWQASDESFTLG